MSKIFCIGLEKTGTTSLIAALEQLTGEKSVKIGGPMNAHKKDLISCIVDGRFNFEIIKDVGIVHVAIRDHYIYYKENYPNSKFIFTDRSINTWLESLKVHMHHRLRRRSKHINKRSLLAIQDYYRLITYGSLNYNKKLWVRKFNEYRDNTLEYFKDDPNFLHINICEENISVVKWMYLCTFLNKKIPDYPFPHKHVRKDMYSDEDLNISH